MVRSLASLCLCAGLVLCCGGSGPTRSARPNLLLVTLDTTRADHLGVYGYPRPTSPNLDRLALRSTVYTHAYSTSSWTLPAHASLFTGKLPTSHGARYDPNGPLLLTSAIEDPNRDIKPRMRRRLEQLGYGTQREIRARTLAADEVTLAQALREAGYDTGAVVAGPWLKRSFGLAKGFASYDDAEIDTGAGRVAESVTRGALAFLEKPRDAPFFLFLNYFDAHRPFEPPEAFAKPFLPERKVRPGGAVDTQAHYDGEIRYADAELARVLHWLERAGRFEQTLIVVTADHGELLGERGLVGHGKYLYEELIRVPLIVKPAGEDAAGRREPEPVLLADLHDLLLGWLGVGPANDRPRRPILAETNWANAESGYQRALVAHPHKLVWSSEGRHRLYDLETDPGESENLVASEPERLRALETQLLSYLEDLPRPGPSATSGEIDAETRRALEQLGYLE